MSRHIQTLVGIGLAVSGSAAPLAAQGQTNRVPDPNAIRVLVTVFRGSEKLIGVQAANAVRSKMNSEFPFKQVYVLPGADINTTLEASGFPTTEPLQSHDARALANLMRADEYITGSVVKSPTGFKMEAALVLARDNALVQPLGTFEGATMNAAAGLVSKELKEARKQLEFERKCVNSVRDGKLDPAAAFAKEGIVAYPKATLARVCLANVMSQQKAAPDQMLKIAREITDLDPKNRFGLQFLANAFRALNQPDSAVRAMTTLLSTDPSNPRLQKDVVEAVAALANPKVARPFVDSAVALNPGDPDLLRLRWLILLAVKDYKEFYAQGEELIKLDTSFADTTYFIRTARVFSEDSQFQKAAETAAKGLVKFPGQPSLIYEQIVSLRAAGQGQQALDALNKALDAKIPVERGSAIRLRLLRELNKIDEIVPAARAMIASGDTAASIRSEIITVGSQQSAAAAASGVAEDFQKAIATFLYADSVSKGPEKARAYYLLGGVYLRFGQMKLKLAGEQKSCELAKQAKSLFADAQIVLPKGGSSNPTGTQQLMGNLMQLDPYADQLMASFKPVCK